MEGGIDASSVHIPIGDIDRRQINRALDPGGARHSDDRVRNPGIPQGKLQRRRGQRHPVPIADCRDLADPVDHLLGCLLVRIARVRIRTLGEHSAAVRCGVQYGDAALGRDGEERIGGGVEQRVAIVRDDGVEDAELDVFDLQVDRPRGDAKVVDQPCSL